MAEYVLRADVVRSCLQRLIDEPIHRSFPGYLCLHQQSTIEGKTSDLGFPYYEFLEAYLRVKERGAKTPYFVPFTKTTIESLESLWLSENLAGSYTPSSLRPNAPLRKIVELEESGGESKFSLQDDHWKLARLELCEGNQIPLESLSAYLLRDYAFRVEDPSAFTVVRTFSEEFGYGVGGKAFSHLYRTGDSDITGDSFKKHE